MTFQTFNIPLLFVFLIAPISDGAKIQFNGIDLPVEPYIFEDLINSTIESFRTEIPDVLQVEEFAITFPDEDTTLTGSASISNFSLTGLQGFEIVYLNFAIVGMNLNFTITFPVLNIFTNYGGDIIISDLSIPFYGHGNLSIYLDNTEIQASAQINLTDGVSIDNFRAQFHIDNGTFDLHGFWDNEDMSSLITIVLNENVIQLIDGNEELISDTISPVLESVINNLLNNAAPNILQTIYNNYN